MSDWLTCCKTFANAFANGFAEGFANGSAEGFAKHDEAKHRLNQKNMKIMQTIKIMNIEKSKNEEMKSKTSPTRP